MGYMTRRIDHLLQLKADDKLRIARPFADSEPGRQLLLELDKVARLPDGSVDLSSCSPLVKSFASAVFALAHYDHAQTAPAVEMAAQIPTPAELSKSMRKYFDLLEAFFVEATGASAGEFDFEHYRAKILGGDKRLALAGKRAYEVYPSKIANFHSDNTSFLYQGGKSLGGLKVVLGGSSRFPGPAFDGVRKVALYADTIFIPDPLLPWLEVDRVEERFSIIEFLRNAYQLLLLKPLVDTDTSFPPILVFPSWEKLFEINDVEAKDSISQLILGFFSAYLGATFEDEEELGAYIEGPGKTDFEDNVTRHGLFWPPEEDGPLPFAEALPKYRAWLSKWRSTKWLEAAAGLSPHALVLNGIVERLAPHYHVRDNAASLHAHPLYWLSPHYHYYKLIAAAANSVVSESALMSSSTFASLESLIRPQTAWLGNIPIADLARLREENANEQFRQRLRSYTDELSRADLDDLDVVAAGVIRGLQSLLDEHDRQATHLAEELERKLAYIVPGSILTLAAALYPWLEPWVGLAVLGPPFKASYHLIEYVRQKRVLSRSLMGVLSEARSHSRE